MPQLELPVFVATFLNEEDGRNHSAETGQRSRGVEEAGVGSAAGAGRAATSRGRGATIRLVVLNLGTAFGVSLDDATAGSTIESVAEIGISSAGLDVGATTNIRKGIEGDAGTC